MVCVCLINTVQELRSMAKIQDKVMNAKSSEQFPCKEGLSWLRLFSFIRDYKRESTENRDFISQAE